MPTALWQVANSTFTNSQILNCTLPHLQFHIVKSSFSHLHFYIANLTSSQCFTDCPKFSNCPQNNPLIAQFFLEFFLPKLCFYGLFSFGVGGGLALVAYPPTSQPTYSLTYILNYLGYLSTYLPTYLGVDPHPHLPTIQDTSS